MTGPTASPSNSRSVNSSVISVLAASPDRGEIETDDANERADKEGDSNTTVQVAADVGANRQEPTVKATSTITST